MAGASVAERAFDAFDGVELGLTPSTRPGLLLRHAREALGASLIDVSRRTRITVRHLEAIERGDYSAFHGRIYAVGFARNYARFVRIAEQPIAIAVSDEYTQAREAYQPHHWG